MVEVIDLPEEPKMYMSSPPMGTPDPKILSPAYALEKSVNAANYLITSGPKDFFEKHSSYPKGWMEEPLKL